MSKLRVDQVETLDGLNTKNVATLIDDINSAGVSTSTGDQSLTDSLDSRVIFKSTKDSLDAIPSGDLSDGQEAQVLGTPFVWDATAGEWFARGPINVKIYGATGDGVTDDGAAVRAAIEALRKGETLLFPPGRYTTAYADPSLLASWIQITESGITLKAAPGAVVLENFLIAVNGSFGSPIDVGASGFTVGDTVIDTASAHGFSDGDVIQLLSQRNSYTTDGGAHQLGSENPTTLALPERRFAEIHEVKRVIDTTSFEIDSSVIYPDYADNTNGLSFPMTGVTSAQVRKINVAKDIVFSGLVFGNTANSGFRSLFAQGVYGLEFEKCGFIADALSGRHFHAQSSYGIRFRNCWDRRAPTGASGSSWNSFFIAGGCQNAFFVDCDFKGGHQIIDFTPQSDDGSPFYSADDLDGLTVQIIGVTGCKLADAQDAATSHPGTYICFFHGNNCFNVATGFRGRSRNMSIQGNNVKCNNSGFVLSAFYEDSHISGNIVRQVVLSEYGGLPSGGWAGVNIQPMSSEIMNNNDVENVVISGNQFFSTSFQSNDMGVVLTHIGNGTPPNGSFTLFTDTIKTNLSNYVITSNVFFRCGVRVRQFINGVSCIQNNFSGCADLPAYFESEADSARHRIGGNYFNGTRPTNSVVTKAPASLTYGYNTQHAVSGNQHPTQVLNNSLADSGAFNTD